MVIRTLDPDSLEMLDSDLYPEPDSMKSGSKLWKLSTVLRNYVRMSAQVKEEMKKEKRRIQEQLRRIKRNQVLYYNIIF